VDADKLLSASTFSLTLMLFNVFFLKIIFYTGSLASTPELTLITYYQRRHKLVDADNMLSASTFTWTLMWFFRYHISVHSVVDADSFLLASTKVDANTEMSLLFLNPREAKFPARLLATTH
jgi:hypothetical protein